MDSGFRSPTASPNSAFEREVQDRFGFVPNFFRTGKDAPGLIEDLWTFARTAYIDNPLPSVFKERLFVHLSRFCHVRYCIVRHVGFLIGHGNPSGDPAASHHTSEQVCTLLQRPMMFTDEEIESVLSRLEATAAPFVPEAESSAEQDVFFAAALLFLEPAHALNIRDAMAKAIGEQNVELLLAFLAFVRTAHYWTVTHPDLDIEEDMETLLASHESLATLLMDKSDGAHSEISQRLLKELVTLRQERDDREALRSALNELKAAQHNQRLLIRELNHRVKNTLAVVQSIASHTLTGTRTDQTVRDALIGRLIALAEAHDILTNENWESANIKEVMRRSVAAHQATIDFDRIRLEGPDVAITPKQALSLSMAAYELATNAIKHGSLSTPSGHVEVQWQIARKNDSKILHICWRERGGPVVEPPTREGFGMLLLRKVLASDVAGTVRIAFEPSGLVVEIEATLQVEALQE